VAFVSLEIKEGNGSIGQGKLDDQMRSLAPAAVADNASRFAALQGPDK